MIYRWLRNPKLLVFIPVLLLLLIAVACGEDATPTPVPTATPSPTATPVPTATPSPTATPVPTPTGPQVDQPKYGGILRVLQRGEAPSLDVHTSNFGLYEHLGNVYQTIVRYDQLVPDNDSVIVGDLANKWEMSPDGKTYTFSFPAGIKWHDGVPFTAEDARVSIRRMEEFAGKKVNIRTVETVEAPDDLTLVVGLSRPTPSFIKGIALGSMPIAAKHIIEREGDLTEVFIGTGPYTFVRYQRGEVLEVDKNPAYYKEGLPYLDGGQFLFILDDATTTAAFRTGRLDLTANFGNITRIQVRTIRRSIPDLQEWEKDKLSAPFLTFNTDQPPWNDVRLRRAAFLAIDRQAAIKVMDEGGRLGIVQFRGDFALPDEEMLKIPGLRPEKDEDRAEARRILADAGFPNGFDTSVIALVDRPRHMTMGTFYADQLSTIGINMKVVGLDVGTWVDRVFARDFETLGVFGVLDLPDPDGVFKIFTPGGLFNVLQDPEIVAGMEAQSKESDPAKRIQIVHDIARRVVEVVPMVMTHWIGPPSIAQPYVRNYTPAVGNFTVGGYLEQLWLDR